MAKITTKTFSGGSSADRIQEYADEIPVDVIDKMLTAEADVIEPAIADNAAFTTYGAASDNIHGTVLFFR